MKFSGTAQRIGLSMALVGALVGASPASAISLLPGFDTSALAANDDGSTGLVGIGFDTNFFGTTYNSLYVNNNGNVTFQFPSGTYTPSALTSPGQASRIAPFFADVDTRGAGSALTRYGTGSVSGRSAFGVTWDGVGYFSAQTNKLNEFQLLLIDRSDTGLANFDIEFRYGQVQWETGSASGGVNGLGGSSARVGYTAGTGVAGTFAELAGSGVNGAFLDGGPNSLVAGSNVGEAGRYLFSVRSGQVVEPPTTEPIPEPSAALLFGVGCLVVTFRRGRSLR